MGSDKFQEYVAGGMAVLVTAAVVAAALLQSIGIAHQGPPDYLLVIASGIASYYYGQRSGATQLNGNVTKLAAAAESLLTSANSSASTAATNAASAAAVAAPPKSPGPVAGS